MAAQKYMKERALGRRGVSGCEWVGGAGVQAGGRGDRRHHKGWSPPARGSFAAEPVSSAYCGGGGGPDRGGNGAWKASWAPWVGGSPRWRVW